MDYDYSELIIRSKGWGEKIAAAGWVSEEAIKPLVHYDTRTPSSLIASKNSRPLIAAFLGGTGVGKSSLLNRLARQEIARTGAERPTSREVTLFHHHSVALALLPEPLPIKQIKLAQHSDEENKHIIWIDMPDVDSIEQSNKHLVLKWLPHIDVLLYVVSPERYRDNKAWRMLLAEGGRFAWLFIINQWDRGQDEQYHDFIRQLGKAGFDQPIVFRTNCNPDNIDQQTDELTQLQSTIDALANQHTIEQLEIRGLQVRKEALKQRLQSCLISLGPEQGFQQLLQKWQTDWPETVRVLEQGFDWPLQRMAIYYAEREAHLLGSKVKKRADADKQKSLKFGLWDEWAQNRYEDALDAIIQQADQSELPIKPIKTALLPLRESGKKIVYNQTELAARQSLARPGNALQRGLIKVARFCQTLLPLAAMSWVGYQAIYGFYNSSLTDKDYLGLDFAIHSLLLVVIAWLIPFFMRRQLKPSLENAALTGLRKGLASAMVIIEDDITSALLETTQQREVFISEAVELVASCDSQIQPRQDEENQILDRMLIESEEVLQ